MLGIVLLAGLAFYMVNAAHFAHQPLRIEENEWPPTAVAIYDHGRPVRPWDESHKLRFAPDGTVDHGDLVGAWHPSLYLYTLAATLPILGRDASYALRGVGIAGLLAACLLLFLIAREVAPRRWPLIGTAAVTLLLVHPYAIQGSVPRHRQLDPADEREGGTEQHHLPHDDLRARDPARALAGNPVRRA